jgi:predicted nucleic acid-binding Zn ribbon protein
MDAKRIDEIMTAKFEQLMGKVNEWEDFNCIECNDTSNHLLVMHQKAADADLDLHQRTAGNWRRLLESVGLQRRAREVNQIDREADKMQDVSFVYRCGECGHEIEVANFRILTPNRPKHAAAVHYLGPR